MAKACLSIFLQQAALPEAEPSGFSNDDVVKQVNLDDGACLFQEFGYLAVGIARLNVARRVVMNENDGI